MDRSILLRVRSACITAALLVFCKPLLADHSPFLDSLLAQAQRANPRLREAAARIDISRANVRTSRAWEDPKLSVEFKRQPTMSVANSMSAPVATGNAFETDVRLEQMIHYPGKLGAMEHAAEIGVGMAEQSRNELDRQIAHDVKKNYAMLYSGQQRLDINARSKQQLDMMIEAATARVGVGTASQADVMRLRIERSRLENDRAALIHDSHMAEMMIVTLCDLQSAFIGALPDIEPFPWTFDMPDPLVTEALEKRSMIKQMRAELEMARADRTAAENDKLPDFMVGAMYMRMVDGMDQYAVMLGTSVPIAPWSSGKWDGALERREAEVRAAEARMHETENMVEFAVHDAWIKAGEHWQQLQRLKIEIIPQSELVFAALLSQYRVGTADLLSLIDSYRMVQMYKMEYFMAFEEYMGYVTDLELAVGKELW
jgi:outer membrane protein TolC